MESKKLYALMVEVNGNNEILQDEELQNLFFEILESNYLPENYDTTEDFINDLDSAYCQAGCFSGLIYYNETKEIFKNYFSEILAVYDEFTEECGHVLQGKLTANNLVWFAFEEYKNHFVNLLNDAIAEAEVEEQEE